MDIVPRNVAAGINLYRFLNFTVEKQLQRLTSHVLI